MEENRAQDKNTPEEEQQSGPTVPELQQERNYLAERIDKAKAAGHFNDITTIKYYFYIPLKSEKSFSQLLHGFSQSLHGFSQSLHGFSQSLHQKPP